MMPIYGLFNNTPSLSVTIGSGVTAFWVSAQLKGDLVSLYGNFISLKLQWTTMDGNFTTLTNLAAYIRSRNNTLKIPIPGVTKDNIFNIMLQVTETSVFTETNAVLTRQQLLLALTDVQAFYIPATFYERSHTSRYVPRLRALIRLDFF